MGDVPEALSTALTSQKEGLPSIFEVKAQDSLDATVKPALKHIVKILAQNAPEKCGWIFRWYDELYTITVLAVQHHFLNSHQASFSEYYYDLQRKPADNGLLDKKQVLKSLIALAIFPYFLEKLEQKFKDIKEECELGQSRDISKLKKLFYHIYPYVHMFWNGVILYYNLMFAIKTSKYHTPIYHMTNLQLVIVDPFNETTVRSGFSGVVTKLFTGSIHLAVFLIQFMENWFSAANVDVVKHSTQLPIPKPSALQLNKTKIDVPAKGICPVCNQKLRNEAVLMTSGYVFCYVCIYRYVKAQQECPVTGYDSSVSHIIRIFSPS